MRGETRPLIVDWNCDRHVDILLSYRGLSRLYILFGGSGTMESLSAIPIEDPKTSAAGADELWSRPEFKTLDIPAFEQLKPRGTDGRPIEKKIGRVDGYDVMERPQPDWLDAADWDGDGDIDLIVSVKSQRWLSYNLPPGDARREGSTRAQVQCPVPTWSLFWLPNRGHHKQPNFGAARLLFELPTGQKLGAFTVADHNGDGSPEIIAGIGAIPEPIWEHTKYRFTVLTREPGE